MSTFLNILKLLVVCNVVTRLDPHGPSNGPQDLEHVGMPVRRGRILIVPMIVPFVKRSIRARADPGPSDVAKLIDSP